MAPQLDDRTLRSVNYRLKNTPVAQLPRIIGAVTSQLVSSNCHLLAPNSEVTWLKTRISSLLQDRSPEGRFSAVVLIKTLLDLGGSSFVTNDKDRVGAWIRGLLDVLKRPGATATKKCALVTLVKAFMLTWDNGTLVRELTTPSLPSFITVSLQHAQGQTQNELIEFVLESFAQLLPRHPTVFRSFMGQIRSLAVATLCRNPFDSETAGVVVTSEAKDAACNVLVLLHQCAQKGGGAAEWEKGIDELLVASHTTLDNVFRAVTEDWQSVAGVRSTIAASEELPHEPYFEQADEKHGFPSWHGLRSGVDRVQSLLSLLQAYIYTPTATSVKIPLGRIIDLLTRLLYVQVPRPKEALGTRYNIQVGREEREELLSLLPIIHVSTLETISTLLARLDGASLPVCAHLLDLITWLFQAEHFDVEVRTAVYRCTAQILSLTGPTLGKTSVKSLDKITRSCCADLLPPKQESQSQTSEIISAQLTNGGKAGKTANGAISVSSTLPSSLAETLPGLYNAAYDLLPVLFNKLPIELVAKAARSEMDRTAILTNHKVALAVSALNPAPQKPSVLPFLSALAPESAVTEAILRPRMPVILTGKQNGAVNVEMEEEQLDADEEKEEEEEGFAMADLIEEETPATAWATTSSIQTKAQPSNTSFGDNMDFGNIKSTPLLASDLGSTTTGKRTVDYEEEETSTTDTKRVRLAEESKSNEPVASALDGVEIQVEVPSVQVTSDIAVETAAAELSDDDDDDDDGSDFEMPKLVFKSDVADDDDEKDQ